MQSVVVTSHGLSDRQVSSLNTFLENFYHLTDDPSAHVEYASQFLPSAMLIMNHTVAQGEKGIIELRENVWSSCTSQKHSIENVIYTHKASAKLEDKDDTTVDTIIFGTVTVVSKNGEQRMVEWVGRAEYVSQNDVEWNVSRYQVYVNQKPRDDLKM